jgi:hypothetical protein
MSNVLFAIIALALLKSTLSFVNRRTKQITLSFVNEITKQSSRVTTQLGALDPEVAELAREALKGASDFGVGAGIFAVVGLGTLGFSIFQTSQGMVSMRDRMDKADERMDKDKADAKVEMDKNKADAKFEMDKNKADVKVEMDKADAKVEKIRTDTQAEIDNKFKITSAFTVLSIVISVLSKLSDEQVHMILNYLRTKGLPV